MNAKMANKRIDHYKKILFYNFSKLNRSFFFVSIFRDDYHVVYCINFIYFKCAICQLQVVLCRS